MVQSVGLDFLPDPVLARFTSLFWLRVLGCSTDLGGRPRFRLDLNVAIEALSCDLDELFSSSATNLFKLFFL